VIVDVMHEPPWGEAGVSGRALHEQTLGLVDFLALNRFEVEQLARRSVKTTKGKTWTGLSNMMERRGYHVVEDLGFDAATRWATHLGITSSEEPRAPSS
jgi:hypothetical protein